MPARNPKRSICILGAISDVLAMTSQQTGGVAHMRNTSLAISKVTPLQSIDGTAQCIRVVVWSGAMRHTTGLRDEVSTDLSPPSVKFQCHAQSFILLTSREVCTVASEIVREASRKQRGMSISQGAEQCLEWYFNSSA